MRIIHIFFKSKWDLSKIKKKKFLLVDGNSNPFLKYYDKKDFNILHRRGEKINIRILIKCIFDLNVSSLNYFNHFICWRYLFYNQELSQKFIDEFSYKTEII